MKYIICRPWQWSFLGKQEMALIIRQATNAAISLVSKPMGLFSVCQTIGLVGNEEVFLVRKPLLPIVFRNFVFF